MKKLGAILSFALVSTLIISAGSILGVEAQETLIWEGVVASQCSPTLIGPLLDLGREYRIVAQGAFASYELTGLYNFVADAQYYTPVSAIAHYYVWDPLNTFPAPGGHSFLQINGMDVNWGPFSNGFTNFTGHEYSISYGGTGAAITFQIVDWIDGDSCHNYCHINLKIYEGPRIPRGETAYAYGGLEYATCFRCMDFDGNGRRDFNNWGWSNGPLGPGHYEFDIWAGAAKCDLSKGDLAGTLTIDYDGSTAAVAYMMNANWTIGYAHLYVDGEPLPRDIHGDYTVSPGQYPYIHYVDGPTHTFTVSGLSGPIYVVAHAAVTEVDG